MKKSVCIMCGKPATHVFRFSADIRHKDGSGGNLDAIFFLPVCLEDAEKEVNSDPLERNPTLIEMVYKLAESKNATIVSKIKMEHVTIESAEAGVEKYMTGASEH